jgi:hypothetical protein
MKQCLDDRLNQRLQQVNTEFDFQLKANERWAVAQRAQIWSQFFQAVREKREQTLESLNKQWYDVQTARRNAHSLQDYGILFPKDPTQRLRNAIAYNSEVSTLAGMAKFEGFPAGPEMKGASALELKSDLSAMEVRAFVLISTHCLQHQQLTLWTANQTRPSKVERLSATRRLSITQYQPNRGRRGTISQRHAMGESESFVT